VGWVEAGLCIIALLAGFVAGRLTVPRGAGTPRADALPLRDGDRPDDRIIQLMIGVLDGPAFALDPGGAVLAYNRGAHALFSGLAAGVPLHHVSRSPDLIDAVQRARRDWRAQTCEISGHSALAKRLLASVSPLEADAMRDVPSILLVQFRDLSELDRLAKLRTDFIANASHELRTPLASIKGFIETLQGPAKGDTAAIAKFLSIMETQASRMARILDDLLSLGRIEMREHVPPSDIVDVAALLRATVEGLEPIARDAKISLHCNSVLAGSNVRGDRDELEQVLQNLIQNAIKYGREGGNVSVSLTDQPCPPARASKVIIAVADDGPGIAREYLPRLTERFYRVDTATSRERGGTGLGLAIVKHIVNRHRGELKIESTLGKGSTFSVVLDADPKNTVD
jgi:two-component system, OmpR family, phosphate regulon sensor histidine kinase PhoR